LPDIDSLASIPLQRRWRSQKMPAPIVVAIISRTASAADGRPEPHYLLIRRAGEPYRGRWALVGGKWDFGEALATAVVREVLEETGLQAEFVALRGIVSERLHPAQPGGNGAAHFLLLVCQVDAPDGRASEQNEGAVGWFSAAQIEALRHEQRIIPSDYVMLKRFDQAPEIPHYEAVMLNQATSGGSGAEGAQLVRFEEGS
jgi:8-oxo-dGTP diphosphatase